MTKRLARHDRWAGNMVELRDTDDHFCPVPGYILKYYHLFPGKNGMVGLKPNEFAFMIHVMSYKYDIPDAQAYPGHSVIAEHLGLTKSSVERIQYQMTNKGALIVTPRLGQTNIYSFKPLIDFCMQKQAEDIIGEKGLILGSFVELEDFKIRN